ncbi:MAG TPA: TonB-dependent receptor [Phenylobacterium sp.]|nr:TonB-dependent receptor [Phenylobacterium sp.]
MQWKHALMASSAMLAVALGSTAHAQPNRPATQAAASNTIEELVVTAEKRAQSLQDVPVAVSAFTSARRDLLGITTIADMTNFTPGLEYNAQNDRNTLRGIGRNTNVHAAEGSVAQYSDGIYTSSTVEAGKTPLFTDRVEVLRGPQGTLYGRNSIGGAINIISKRPTEDFYAEVRAQVQNYDHTIVEAAVSGPTAIPGVQFRLGANWERQTQGWYKNTVPGQPNEGNIINTEYYEGQLKFHFNDKFEGWVKLAGANWDNDGGGPGSRNTFTKVNFPAGTLTPGLSSVGGGNPTFPNYLAVTAGLTPNSGYACLPTALTGVTNIVTAGGLSVAQACANANQNDPRKFTSDVPYQVKLKATTIFASEWIYHLTDAIDVKYIAGGTHYHYFLNGPTPVDQAPITSYELPFATGGAIIPGATGALSTVNPRYAFNYQEKENWYSHEINVASTGDSPFQWIGGLYYYREDYTQPVYTYMPDQGAPVTNGPFLTNAVCAFTGGQCPQLAGNNRIYDDRPQLDIKSEAVFGQIDWAFTPHWKTTLGLRYTYDRKVGQESIRLLCFDVPACAGSPENFTNFLIDLTQLPSVISGLVPGQPGAPGVTPGVSSLTTVDPATGFATRHYDNNWSATTGTAGVQWDPDPDTMAYIRYSRGYKAGAFRIGINTTIGASPNSNPEHMNDYEIGLKKNFGRTFQANIALFYEDYSNDQIPINIAATSGGLAQSQSVFFNVPKAVSQGVEIETTWQPIDHLQILVNYSYDDAHITQAIGVVDPADPAALDPSARPIITQAQCLAAVGTTNACTTDVFTTGLPNGGFQRGQNLSGQNLPNAPKNKVSVNVNYTWEMEKGSLTPSMSYVWRDKQYGSIFNRPWYLAPSYDQLDLRLTWKSMDNHYSIIGFARNVTDTIGYEGGGGISGIGAVRNAGFVPQHVLTGGASTTPVPVLEGISTGYALTPPRTYGIELQYRF